ncbi:hypothetical protein [Lactiplantibacillus paraplantarum]|uniref:hypothetical protein n=1 Tax=Lactiplantibacillus paraplantarum TaxID=60520 RepID=UPI0023AA9813|nr:hypothetical protein [Lactiplantibacillus paraplantarum]WEE37252.1 hypothetical protein PWO93_06625 [Lactiplantibacillus paraplantarum]
MEEFHMSLFLSITQLTATLTIIGYIIYWIKCKITTKPKILRKRQLSKWLFVYIILLLVTGTMVGKIDSKESTDNAVKTPTAENRGDKSQFSKATAKTALDHFNSMSSKQMNQYNTRLATALKTQQRLANDNKQYLYLQFINDMAFHEHVGLDIHVTSEFLSGNNSQKTALANLFREFSIDQLSKQGFNIVKSPYGLRSKIYFNDEEIGRSKMMSESSFKWND